MYAGVLVPPPTYVVWTTYIQGATPDMEEPGMVGTFVIGTWDSIFQRIETEGLASSAAPNVGSCNALRKVLHDQRVEEAMSYLQGPKLYMRTVTEEWIRVRGSIMRTLSKNLEFLIVSEHGT
eukprot:GHVU01093886.1.p1 GENE.GHVU01093886.1~~GHVU01093886.1.p1  ORF type:complete len:122 (+),score=4.92 GHVU01093886.1:141-506(+)